MSPKGRSVRPNVLQPTASHSSAPGVNGAQGAPTISRTLTPKEAQRAARVRTWRRDTKLAALGYDSYDAYIRSTQWKEKRAAYYRRYPNAACICGADERLVLHHVTYDRVGDEDLRDLMALCPECHDLVHALERHGLIPIDTSGLTDSERAGINHVREVLVRQARKAQDERAQDAFWGKIRDTHPVIRINETRKVVEETELARDTLRHLLFMLRNGRAPDDTVIIRKLERIEAQIRATARGRALAFGTRSLRKVG